MPRRTAQTPEGRPWVIVGCGSRKQNLPVPAGDMYVGSYHRLARRAAAALTGSDQILILSARYGLVHLDDLIEPYDLRVGHPGSIGAAELAEQAAAKGLTAGSAYTNLARSVWPELAAPLANCRGIGEQQAVLARIAGGAGRTTKPLS